MLYAYVRATCFNKLLTYFQTLSQKNVDLHARQRCQKLGGILVIRVSTSYVQCLWVLYQNAFLFYYTFYIDSPGGSIDAAAKVARHVSTAQITCILCTIERSRVTCDNMTVTVREQQIIVLECNYIDACVANCNLQSYVSKITNSLECCKASLSRNA